MAQSKLTCNPFNKPRHCWVSRIMKLRHVTAWMCQRASISMGSMICDTCRRKLMSLPILTIADDEEVNDSSDYHVPETGPGALEDISEDSKTETDSEMYFDSPTAVASLNQCLTEIGLTPYSKTKACQPCYPSKKMKEITQATKQMIISAESDDDDDESEQLKDKFKITTLRSEQLRILTVLPQSWSIQKIEKEFGVTNYMARKSKELVREKGILSTPDPKPGPSLPSETIHLVVSFYQSDDISRVMPGKKDFVSVSQQGKRVHFQKRLVLSNLKEVYRAFKDQFPSPKIGFSKFAELRPKHCILAGASGTHSVCVCTIHQNVKLMMLGVKLSDLPTYHTCIAKIICNPPLPRCYLGYCKVCPGITPLKEHLTTSLDESLIDYIIFKQWVSVDRTTLETYSKPVDEFVEMFCDKLELLRPHSFIASEQARFYKEYKTNLVAGEMLVTVDFSENYSFVLQDAAQGFHWNNSQATLHPFVAYYIDAGKLTHLSYVVVSDCMHHDATAVYVFQKAFINTLKRVLPERLQPRKIVYISDGTGSQYKNRKDFVNLCHHKNDFGISAEWHFTATSHGKGACDGLGGTVKRLAAKASLQRPYNEQLMTPRQLFDWASKNIPAVHFGYCSNEDYESEHQNFEQRFRKSRTIPGTRKLHSYVPISDDKLQVKPFSACTTFKEEKVTTGETDILALESISGFVTCWCDERWWLACVLQVYVEESQVKLTFLHPHGPCSSFRYPSMHDVRIVPAKDILTIVDPRTRTGRVYILLKKDSKSASEKLSALLAES